MIFCMFPGIDLTLPAKKISGTAHSIPLLPTTFLTVLIFSDAVIKKNQLGTRRDRWKLILKWMEFPRDLGCEAWGFFIVIQWFFGCFVLLCFVFLSVTIMYSFFSTQTFHNIFEKSFKNSDIVKAIS